MKVKLTQKVTTLDNKKIAYVECALVDGKYTYKVMFDKQTKKRYNAYVRSLGFEVGEVTAEPAEKTLEV